LIVRFHRIGEQWEESDQTGGTDLVIIVQQILKVR